MKQPERNGDGPHMDARTSREPAAQTTLGVALPARTGDSQSTESTSTAVAERQVAESVAILLAAVAALLAKRAA